MSSDHVELRVPASGAYVSVLRTATAGLAARLDFTVDDIEDLRIAVDEACAVLLPLADAGARLIARFDLEPGSLQVAVSVNTFAWTVLTALAGDVEASVDDGRVTLTLRKTLAVNPG
jgi:serine/threonine-protein kinase RsbW